MARPTQDQIHFLFDSKVAALRDTITLPDDWAELLATVLTVDNKRNRCSVLSKVRPDADDRSRCLMGIINWHGSGGNLFGYMMARYMVPDQADFDRIESLATMVAVLTGRCNAVGAWARALNITPDHEGEEVEV